MARLATCLPKRSLVSGALPKRREFAAILFLPHRRLATTQMVFVMNEPELDRLEANHDDSETRGEFQALCQIIRTCTVLTELSEKWNFLGGRGDLLRIDMLPTDFVTAMEHELTPEELAKLGLHERVADELRLPSWLDNNIELYVAIDESNQTFAFSTGNKFLFPMTRTALDQALERIPPDFSQAPLTLFIVESSEAAELMQRLGLESVSCTGLEELDGDDVRRLFSGDQQSDFGWRFSLLLVDFDVVRLKNRPSAALEEVINRLADAQAVYGVDPSRRFGVCRPTTCEFQCLEHATAFKDPAQIRHMFENWSTAARRVTVGNWRSQLALERLSFSSARRELTHALQLPNGFARQFAVQAAFPAYRAASKEAVMQKFFDAIDRARDPFDQFDMMAAASYAEIFLDNDPLVRAAEAVLAREIPASAGELCDESFEQRRRCMLELRRIRDRQLKR